MTNFDIFLSEPKFASFAEVAVSAERILQIDPAACVLNCRRAMEFAVKWMYSADEALELPWDDKLVSLMSTDEFRDVVGADMLQRLHYIRKVGNTAAHAGSKISREQAVLCLENLYIFLDFVAYCYGENYEERAYDPNLLNPIQEPAGGDSPAKGVAEEEVDLAALMAENAALKAELTARRESQQQSYVPKPLELTEYKTRKLYIDAMLEDAGWVEGKNWINEYEIPGMPNKSEVGFADYVLLGDDGRILAVIEAKRTCVDVAKGRQQAKLYADLIEKQQGRRPVVFLTNGFETRIVDNRYPERRVASIYSKRDLEKLFNLQRMRSSLKNIIVDKHIAGRYYQEAAIKAGHRLRQDAHGHRARQGAAGTGLDQKRPLPRRPQLPRHTGQAQLRQSPARPLGDQSLRGKGQLRRPRGVLHLPDHDELHRRGAGRGGQALLRGALRSGDLRRSAPLHLQQV